jgi:hypothetical protein
MLEAPAISSAMTMKVNPSEGSRECPVIFYFSIGDCDKVGSSSYVEASSSSLHMNICAEEIVIYTESDPSPRRQKHFWIF